jgi:hypothetical protein
MRRPFFRTMVSAPAEDATIRRRTAHRIEKGIEKGTDQF